MGLLGDNFDDPKTSAILALSGGLLRGDMGGGLLGANQAFTDARQNAFKQKYMQAQMDEMLSQSDLRKQQAAQIQRRNDMINGWLGKMDSAVPGANQAVIDQTGGLAPTRANGQLQTQAVNQLQAGNPMAGIPREAINADLAFNDGKNVPEWMFKRGVPDMQVTNGYAYDKNRVQPGFLPQFNVSQDGKATLSQIGPDGLPVVSAPSGSLNTFRQFEDAKNRSAAGSELTQVWNPEKQRFDFVPKSQVLEAAQPPAQATPGAPISNPGNLRPTGASTGFAKFSTPEEGLAAMDQNLRAYAGKGINTVAAAISRWAPPTENDTASYIKDVSTRLGVNPNQPIDLNNPLVRHAMTTAIMLHEQGPSRVFAGGAPAGPMAAQPSVPEATQTKTSQKFAEEAAGKYADTLDKSATSARAASDDLLGIEQARKTLQSGAFVGSGAETKLAVAKFINANIPGVSIDPEKVANTDYLKSTLGRGLLEQAKTLGSNPSNADANRINDIVGSIGKDPNALAKMLDWRQEMAQRAIQQHNTRVDQAERSGFTAPFDLRVKNPMDRAPKVSAGVKPSDLTVGQTYTLPNGKTGVWDGLRFTVK